MHLENIYEFSLSRSETLLGLQRWAKTKTIATFAIQLRFFFT